MKKRTNKKLFSSLMACLLIVTFLSSCKKDKEDDAVSTPTETTVKQDQDNMLATTDALANDIVDVMNTEAVDAGSSLMTYMSSDAVLKKGDIKDQIGAKLRILMYNTKEIIHLKKVSSAKTAGTEAFDFNSKTGTYTWNNTKKQWDSTGTSDKIIINFPSDTNNASVNNATLTISAYSEQIIVDSMGNQYMPSRLVANLVVDKTEFASIDYTGSFNNDGIPVAINLNLFVKPYTLAVLLNNQTTTIIADVKLTKDGQTIIGVGGTLVFVDATQEEIKTVDATVQLKQLSVTGSANVAALSAIQSPTVADLNNNIKASVLYSGTKAGDIVFVEDATNNNEPVITIKFKDGSTQPAEEFFANVIQKVENALKDAMSKK